MTPLNDDSRRKLLLSNAFRMPSVQTMVSRKSSITNAFVNAVIPAICPSLDDIEEALAILRMEPGDVRCAYCGNPMTEWDHLRPLVSNHRPTGYISEIANLVPACPKCNQSKGGSEWRKWMLGTKAKHSPTKRMIPNLVDRVARLEAYERWRNPIKIDFESIIGVEAWNQYWLLWESVNKEMRKCQEVADLIRQKIFEGIQGT